MMTDPIADMLTRIRNAVRVERPHVEMPASKVKRGLADVLKREGYIWDWQEVEDGAKRQLRIELKYGPNGERVIQHVKRVSKPGRRIYSKADGNSARDDGSPSQRRRRTLLRPQERKR
jgi:small subunit ribosomal protein S8